MPKNIKIVSVLTFSILTLQLQLHANEIPKGPNNPNNKEFSPFNADQSKVIYATLAVNNSQEKEYGEFYPDYKAETLEDFLLEHSQVGIAGKEFSRFLGGISAYRKRRCPSRIYQNHLNEINSNIGKRRKVRLIEQYSPNVHNKSIVTRPCKRKCNDESAKCQDTKTKPNKYNFKTKTSDTLFPPVKLYFNNHPESSAFTSIEVDPKWLPFETASIKSNIESNYSSNYYYFNKGRKVPVPKLKTLTTKFVLQAMHGNKTKYFYDPNKSTKSISESDRLPEESYLFDTTTSKVFRVEGSHSTNLLHPNELLQLKFDNQSSIMHNESSLNFGQAIDKCMPSIINSTQLSNVEGKIERNEIDDRNNTKFLIKNAVLENNLKNDSLTPAKQYDPNPHFESKLTFGSPILGDNSLRNVLRGNGTNDLEYITENKEKSPSKNQLEAVFVSEIDYKLDEKDRRNLDGSRHLKEKDKDTSRKDQNNYTRNSNLKISPMKRDSSVSHPKDFKQERKELRYMNYTETAADRETAESILIKNVSNQKLLPLSKRQVSEEGDGHETSDLLSNMYDDYDYYFIIGDNNNSYEPPFQNDYRITNLRTENNIIQKLDSNNESVSYKLENFKNLKLTKSNQNQNISRKKLGFGVGSMNNNTIGNFSTLSPNIIQKFWPNVGNREKLCLQDGKNYILNLFRRKGNYSKGKHSTSSTTSKTLMKNFFFRERRNCYGNELGEIHGKALLEDLVSNDEYYRKRRTSDKITSHCNSSHNVSLPSERNDKSFKFIDKRNIKAAFGQLNNQSLLQKSTFQSNDGNYFNNINDIFEILQEVVRPKRKPRMIDKSSPVKSLPPNKHLRRSILNGEVDDYNTKFQNLQKDLLELQKAISAPKASHSSKPTEEKNLTLQIRVIVDVVNNSLGPTENPEEEQLKKRDTKLVEKKGNFGIPMPLEHDSPLVGEKKGTDVWRNKRVDSSAVNESRKKKLHIEKGNSSKSDLSDDIIRNITYLLDNLLENYKLQNRERKKYILDHSVTTDPEHCEDQKLKHSLIHLRKNPLLDVKTQKPIITDNFLKLLGDIKNQDSKDVTHVNHNNLLMEMKKLLPSEMFTLLSSRNRRATNEKESQKKITDYNNKLMQDEISALYNIVKNIKNRFVLKKLMGSSGNEDNLLNELKPFQDVKRTSDIHLQDNKSNINKNDFHVMKYPLSDNDAKVDEILETLGNIGKELRQIDSKEKFLHGILGPEMNNHKNRNKKKNNRRKNNILVSSLKLNKPVYAKNKKHIKETEVKKKKKVKEPPPCCNITTVDEGNHLSVEWCCPDDVITSLAANVSTICFVITPTELSTESDLTSAQKTKQTEEESKTLSTQTTKETGGNTISTTITSSTQATNQVQNITTSAQTTKEVSENTSSIQTMQVSESIMSSTVTTQKGEQRTMTTIHLKKRNHNHGHQVHKKHSRYKENLLSGKYIPKNVEESFQYLYK